MNQLCAIKFTIFAVTITSLAFSAQASDAPCVANPTTKKCDASMTLKGGTLSPVFQTGTDMASVPAPWLANTSFCFPVLYQIKAPQYSANNNFHIWTNEGRWMFRAGQNDSSGLLHVRCFMPDETVNQPQPVPVPLPEPAMLRGRIMFDMPESIGHDLADCSTPSLLTSHPEYKVEGTRFDASFVGTSIANSINGTAHCLCKDLTGTTTGEVPGHVGFWSKQLGFLWIQNPGDGAEAALQRLEASGRHVIGVRAAKGSKFTIDKVICQVSKN